MSKACGNCTVCRVVPKVNEFNKPCGQQCFNPDTSLSGSSCTIHDLRSYRYQQFECWWLNGNEAIAPSRFKPDRCGIMVYVHGHVIYVWEYSAKWEGSELQNWIIPRAGGRAVAVVHRYI